MRALRWTGRHAAAALVGAAVAGIVTGLAARLVMWGIRLANPSHNGAVTHEGVVNGQWTWSGTWNLVTTALSYALLGGLPYLLVRPLLRGGEALRGLEFGVLAFVLGGTVVLDDSYEYVRFVSTWIAVLAFASLYPLYGVVLGAVAGRIAPSPRTHHWPRVTAAASLVLALFAAVQAVGIVGHLRRVYFP